MKRRRHAARVLRLAASGGLITAIGALGAASGAGPASASVSYTASAAAPVAQITEDEPTANFHPEGEGDYGYTLATAVPGQANALAAVVWPGGAAGNAGTLAGLLGVPGDLSALNDPVQASAGTGGSTPTSNVGAAPGPQMSASVAPTGPDDEHTTATSALSGGGLGPAGTIGNSTSTSTVDFNADTAVLSVSATSEASHIDVGGVVRIGSFSSSASADSTNGAPPKMSGATNFHDMSIAGQEAYVDGSGVHLGAPGAPAGVAAVDAVDAALAASGMEVYFTAPHTISVGGVSYYYSSSVLFFWAPPQDTSHNSFTMSLGGSAVAVTDSSVDDGFSGFGDLGGSGTGASTSPLSSPAAVPTETSTSPAVTSSPALAGAPVPSSTGGGPTISAPPGATLSLPASPLATGNGAVPAAVRLPGGIGAGWWMLVALAAVAGATLTTRVPGLLRRQAAAGCPRANSPTTPTVNPKEVS